MTKIGNSKAGANAMLTNILSKAINIPHEACQMATMKYQAIWKK